VRWQEACEVCRMANGSSMHTPINHWGIRSTTQSHSLTAGLTW
jgi:hypothetical protein